MPKQYEKIRDSYIAAGKPVQEAKKLAAMTYNKHHKANPVTRATPDGESAKQRRMEHEQTLKDLRKK